MYLCLYKKSVCKWYRTEGVYCRYLYSLGEYICLLLIVYLKISLIYMYYIICTFKSTLYAKFLCKVYNLIKIYNKLLVIQA